MTNTIDTLNRDIAEAEARIAVDMRIIETARATIKQLTSSAPYTMAILQPSCNIFNKNA